MGDFSAPATAIPEPGQNNVFFRVCSGADTVIVFVHGILSDSRSCWMRQHQAATVYWPALICTDGRLNGISIFLAGYEASAGSGPNGISDSAQYVMNALRRRDSYKPPIEYARIIFVCHSTGGIVARYLLERYWAEFQHKTIGLVLIASPSAGSRYANLIAPLARLMRNKQAQQLILYNWSLDDLDERFKALLARCNNIHGVEAFEAVSILNHAFFPWIPVVVGKPSAAKYFAEARLLAGTNHFTSVKPLKREDRPHELLIDFLQNQLGMAKDHAPVGQIEYPRNSEPGRVAPGPHRPYAVYALVGAALTLGAAYFGPGILGAVREKTAAFSQEWHADLRNPAQELVLREWDEPAARSISGGELVFSGTRPVLFTGFPEYEIRDFKLDFVVDLHKNQKAVSWVLRSDRAKRNYYRFTLAFEPYDAQKPPSATIRGVAVRGGKESEEVTSGSYDLPFAPLVEREKLSVHVEASGCTFGYDFWVQSPPLEQIRASGLQGQAISALLDTRLGFINRCHSKHFTAVSPCFQSGRFGFLAAPGDQNLRLAKIDLNDAQGAAGADRMCRAK